MNNIDKVINKKPIVIVGCGGFGREVLEIFKAQNKLGDSWNILGFVDDNNSLQGKIINGFPVLGNLDWFREQHSKNIHCVCAIGDCKARKDMVTRLKRMGVRFCNAIHPSVIMSEFVYLGEDVIIACGSIITVNTRLRDHVQIDTNCSIAHDVEIGDFCRLGPGVKISGNDRLCEGVYVGTGATLIQQISVEKWSTIGAGAVVVDDIPEYVVAVGVPAKVIKSELNKL